MELSSRPPFLPPQPPLTEEQARQLVSVSGIPADFTDLNEELIQDIVDRSASQPPKMNRPFATLLQLAKNVCSTEGIEANANRVRAKLEEIKGTEDEELGDTVRKSFVLTTSIHLVEGFDMVNAAHFTYDASGNITGVNETNKSRAPKCDEYLRGKKWRPGAPDVGYGGKKKRRETKKRGGKKRKTLRRTRH